MRGGVAMTVAAWLAAAPGLVAGAEPNPAPASRTPASSLPIHDGILELSLHDAVLFAIERSLDVELLRFDPLVAEEDLGAAWGAYDPELFGEGGYAKTDTLNAVSIIGTPLQREKIWDGQAGLRGLIPWLGGSYQAGYEGSQALTNSSIRVLSPERRAGFTVAVTAPLLKGLFWSDPWTLVRLSRVGVDASQQKFVGELMDVVRRTEDAYWALLAAQDGRRVAEKSLETAKALLEQTEAQYEVGVVSKVEVVQAEAGVADREFSLIRADAVERNTQDALIDAVLGPYLQPETELTVSATDRPEEITVREVSAAAATEHAMARRPELALARKEIERRKIEVRKASNDRLPQLDVTASYGQGGLTGRTRPDCTTFDVNFQRVPCPEVALPSEWIDADNNFFSGDASEQYAVRGLLSIPLGNNTARHQHDRAKLELRRAQTALNRLEQSIVSEIRRAARNLRSSLQGIEAAERARVAAEEQLRAERIRLEHGESTPFDVLQREEDLVTAEAQKIVAEQTYHNAISALDRAQGTILDRNQIVVEEAAALR